jgi:hypothetical protein
VSRYTMRLLILATLVGGVMLGGASLAVASSDTGTQNPDLTVTTSLLSSGTDPDRATLGDTISSSSSVTNNTSRYLLVKLSRSLTGPADNTLTRSVWVILAPGRTYSISWSFQVGPLLPLGTYTRTAAASNVNGESSATASIEIY